jgi:uncharacterized protein (DUF58 family)
MSKKPHSASADGEDVLIKDGISGFLNPAEMFKLRRLALLSRYTVEGNLAGAHRSPKHGPSSEFASHKPYGMGDDPKHIDWRVMARTDKYYVKQYEDETNLRVYLALDRSASMGYKSADGPTKYEHACRLAAAVGYLVVKARDSVGLFLHSEKVDVRVDASNSFQHLNNLLKHLQKSPPSSGSGIAATLHEIAASVSRRALIVVISDLLGDEDEIALAMARLRKQRHDVIVFQTLDPAEMDFKLMKACELFDLETGETLAVDPNALAKDYRKAFEAFIEKYRKSFAGMNIDYRVVRTDQPLDTFVRAYLEERRRLSK